MSAATTIRRWWLALSVFYLSLWLHLAIYRFVQGQCTSASCSVLAIGQVALGIAVLAITFSLDRTQAARILRTASKLPPSIYLLAASAILFGFGLSLRPEWVYAHMSFALSGLLALGYLTLYEDRMPHVSRSLLVVGLGLLVVVVAFIRVRVLASHPSVHILDEPWTLSWAVSYLRTGQPSDWIMGSVSGSPYYSLPRYYALVAAWLQLTGVGLWEGRLFSGLTASLMIVLTTLAARNFFNRQAAFITLFALLASSVLVVGLRLRHDIGVGLAIAASLWMYSVARRRQGWLFHALAGMLAGLGVGAHYHAVGFSAALAAGLYLPAYLDRLRRRQFIPPPEALAFCVGAAATGLLILGWQVLPDVEQFSIYLAPRSPRTITEFLESLVYHVAQVAEHSQLEFLLIALAVGAALLRRTKIDLSLALSLVLGYLALALMASKYYGPFDYYSVPLMPVIGLLIGRFFARLDASALFKNVRHSVATVACLCFLMPQLAYSLHVPLDFIRAGAPLRPAPPPAAQWVLNNIPRDQTVVAEHLYFIWLHDYPFLSPLTPSYIPAEEGTRLAMPRSEEALKQTWTQLSADVFIVDPTLATAGVLAQLVDSGYLQEQGYEVVFTEQRADGQSVTVYQRK